MRERGGSGEDERESAGRPVAKGRWRVLFVCTGNTCRSPLAEAIARARLSVRGASRVSVSSAGTSAYEGAPASEGSLRIAREHGLDLSGHRSTPLTPGIVQESDLVLVMTETHRSAVEAMGGGGKTALLGAYAEGAPTEEARPDRHVPDPFGGDDAAYREAYEAIERLVEKALARMEREAER